MKQPAIQFQNFSFQYDSQAKPTLKNIHLTIEQGEKVLIVGPSGSGKSTLGHAINGLVPFSYKGEITGSLHLFGKDAKNLSIFDRSKIVGTVLQDPDGQFISLTVGEDIAFALENDCIPQQEMFERVKHAARLVEMEEYLPTSVQDLSGGQKQRVSIAGVLVNQVDILLFDEPLANLDPATGERVMALIDQIQKDTGKTIVIIEHRLEDVLTQHVDRVVVINNGELLADLPPDELLSTNILGDIQIREPLYIKAAKMAGCTISKDLSPANINQFKVEQVKEPLLNWFQSSKIPEKKIAEERILEVKNLSFRYENGRQAINDVSFSINRGEMISIIGNNGAGKSTLSKLICGFEKPASGSIFYAEKDITKDTIKQRSERIGMVLQNPNHMISKPMIFDEVAFGLVQRGVPEEEIRERVYDTLKICGLYPYRNWPISALSFGQKKRVTIASILVLEPEVIILDEPTAGQDYRHYKDIMDFLVELNRLGKTILMITHDMHLMLEYTTRGIVLNDGKKIADDSVFRILSNEEILQKASLKKTSLYTLAERLGVNEESFVERFIFCEQEEKQQWPK